MSDYTEYAEYYKKHWEKTLGERTSELQEEIKTLRAENARYREALVSIDAHQESSVYVKYLAREALKGGE